MKLFNNTEVAFSLKSDSQLERAYFLFKMIESQPLVRIGTAVTNFALKAAWTRMEGVRIGFLDLLWRSIKACHVVGVPRGGCAGAAPCVAVFPLLLPCARRR